MGHSMRTEQYRYTEWSDRDETVVARELYDLETAPFGTVNVANRPERAALVNSLAAQLREGWKRARS